MPESMTTSETTRKTSAETRSPTEGDIADVAKLLAGEELGQDDDQDAETRTGGDNQDESIEASEAKPETAKSKGKPKTLDALAETLGVEVSELYKVAIPHGQNGESLTLGELKDLASKSSSLEVDRLEWEETKAKKEREFLRSASELNELIGMLPKSAISRELLDAVRAKREQTVEREEAQTLRVIDAWQDSDVRARDEKAMNDLLVEYGLPSNYLSSVVDHRVRAFIRDATLRKQRIDAALAQVKTVTKPTHSPSRRPPIAKPDGDSTRKGRRVNSQVEQVAKLLGSAN